MSSIQICNDPKNIMLHDLWPINCYVSTLYILCFFHCVRIKYRFLVGFVLLDINLCVCFEDRCVSFCPFFRLAIVLSVPLRFTDSDYLPLISLNSFYWTRLTTPCTTCWILLIATLIVVHRYVKQLLVTVTVLAYSKAR